MNGVISILVLVFVIAIYFVHDSMKPTGKDAEKSFYDVIIPLGWAIVVLVFFLLLTNVLLAVYLIIKKCS